MSKPIRFLIGPRKTEFYVHSHFVPATFPILRGPVHSKYADADRVVELNWADEIAFAALCQYLYTGDYDESFTETSTKNPLLTNAHVYILADRWEIRDLARIALENIKPRPEPECTPQSNVVELVRYCCERVVPNELTQHLADYLSDDLAALRDKEVQAALSKSREMSRALITVLVRRFSKGMILKKNATESHLSASELQNVLDQLYATVHMMDQENDKLEDLAAL